MKEFNGKKGYWITIRGNHIFVEKGKTVSQAFTDYLINAENYENDLSYSLNDYDEDLKWAHNIEIPGEYTFSIYEDGQRISKKIKADSLLEALNELDKNYDISTISVNGKRITTTNIGSTLNTRSRDLIIEYVQKGEIKLS